MAVAEVFFTGIIREMRDKSRFFSGTRIEVVLVEETGPEYKRKKYYHRLSFKGPQSTIAEQELFPGSIIRARCAIRYYKETKDGSWGACFDVIEVTPIANYGFGAKQRYLYERSDKANLKS